MWHNNVASSSAWTTGQVTPTQPIVATPTPQQQVQGSGMNEWALKAAQWAQQKQVNEQHQLQQQHYYQQQQQTHYQQPVYGQVPAGGYHAGYIPPGYQATPTYQQPQPRPQVYQQQQMPHPSHHHGYHQAYQGLTVPISQTPPQQQAPPIVQATPNAQTPPTHQTPVYQQTQANGPYQQTTPTGWGSPQVQSQRSYGQTLPITGPHGQTPPITNQAPPLRQIPATAGHIPPQALPITGQTPPFPRQAPPTTGQAPPFSRQTPPITGQTPPFSRQTPPITGQTPPFSRQTPPITGQALPLATPIQSYSPVKHIIESASPQLPPTVGPVVKPHPLEPRPPHLNPTGNTTKETVSPSGGVVSANGNIGEVPVKSKSIPGLDLASGESQYRIFHHDNRAPPTPRRGRSSLESDLQSAYTQEVGVANPVMQSLGKIVSQLQALKDDHKGAGQKEVWPEEAGPLRREDEATQKMAALIENESDSEGEGEREEHPSVGEHEAPPTLDSREFSGFGTYPGRPHPAVDRYRGNSDVPRPQANRQGYESHYNPPDGNKGYQPLINPDYEPRYRDNRDYHDNRDYYSCGTPSTRDMSRPPRNVPRLSRDSYPNDGYHMPRPSHAVPRPYDDEYPLPSDDVTYRKPDPVHLTTPTQGYNSYYQEGGRGHYYPEDPPYRGADPLPSSAHNYPSDDYRDEYRHGNAAAMAISNLQSVDYDHGRSGYETVTTDNPHPTPSITANPSDVFVIPNLGSALSELQQKGIPSWLKKELEELEAKRLKEAQRHAHMTAHSRHHQSHASWRDELSDEEDTDHSPAHYTRESPAEQQPDSDSPVREEEERQGMIIKVRHMLTEVLLEVTDSEIELVCAEFLGYQKFINSAAEDTPNMLPGLSAYSSPSDVDEFFTDDRSPSPSLDPPLVGVVTADMSCDLSATPPTGIMTTHNVVEEEIKEKKRERKKRERSKDRSHHQKDSRSHSKEKGHHRGHSEEHKHKRHRSSGRGSRHDDERRSSHNDDEGRSSRRRGHGSTPPGREPKRSHRSRSDSHSSKRHHKSSRSDRK